MLNRRNLLKNLGASAGITIWAQPRVESVLLPAHASSSPAPQECESILSVSIAPTSVTGTFCADCDLDMDNFSLYVAISISNTGEVIIGDTVENSPPAMPMPDYIGQIRFSADFNTGSTPNRMNETVGSPQTGTSGDNFGGSMDCEGTDSNIPHPTVLDFPDVDGGTRTLSWDVNRTFDGSFVTTTISNLQSSD